MDLSSQVEREFVSWMEFYPHSKGQDPSPGSLRLPRIMKGRPWWSKVGLIGPTFTLRSTL